MKFKKIVLTSLITISALTISNVLNRQPTTLATTTIKTNEKHQNYEDLLRKYYDIKISYFSCYIFLKYELKEEYETVLNQLFPMYCLQYENREEQFNNCYNNMANEIKTLNENKISTKKEVVAELASLSESSDKISFDSIFGNNGENLCLKFKPEKFEDVNNNYEDINNKYIETINKIKHDETKSVEIDVSKMGFKKGTKIITNVTFVIKLKFNDDENLEKLYDKNYRIKTGFYIMDKKTNKTIYEFTPTQKEEKKKKNISNYNYDKFKYFRDNGFSNKEISLNDFYSISCGQSVPKGSIAMVAELIFKQKENKVLSNLNKILLELPFSIEEIYSQQTHKLLTLKINDNKKDDIKINIESVSQTRDGSISLKLFFDKQTLEKLKDILNKEQENKIRFEFIIQNYQSYFGKPFFEVEKEVIGKIFENINLSNIYYIPANFNLNKFYDIKMSTIKPENFVKIIESANTKNEDCPFYIEFTNVSSTINTSDNDTYSFNCKPKNKEIIESLKQHKNISEICFETHKGSEIKTSYINFPSSPDEPIYFCLKGSDVKKITKDKNCKLVIKFKDGTTIKYSCYNEIFNPVYNLSSFYCSEDKSEDNLYCSKDKDNITAYRSSSILTNQKPIEIEKEKKPLQMKLKPLIKLKPLKIDFKILKRSDLIDKNDLEFLKDYYNRFCKHGSFTLYNEKNKHNFTPFFSFSIDDNGIISEQTCIILVPENEFKNFLNEGFGLSFGFGNFIHFFDGILKTEKKPTDLNFKPNTYENQKTPKTTCFKLENLMQYYQLESDTSLKNNTITRKFKIKQPCTYTDAELEDICMLSKLITNSSKNYFEAPILTCKPYRSEVLEEDIKSIEFPRMKIHNVEEGYINSTESSFPKKIVKEFQIDVSINNDSLVSPGMKYCDFYVTPYGFVEDISPEQQSEVSDFIFLKGKLLLEHSGKVNMLFNE